MFVTIVSPPSQLLQTRPDHIVFLDESDRWTHFAPFHHRLYRAMSHILFLHPNLGGASAPFSLIDCIEFPKSSAEVA
jgi:hypothetical protein